MIHSRVTSKSQVTVPRSVRAALGVAPGDQLVWHLEGGQVVVTRAIEGSDTIDPFATFSEWSDELDSAYDDL
nr:type II toxin-antitoxin system PrlF family antitoxin [uncultured Sphingosinicella sp.]